MNYLLLALMVLLIALHLPYHPVSTAVRFGAQTVIASTTEANYFATNGRYFQVKYNNQVPSYEGETPITALGGQLPYNVRIDVYQSPLGFGFQVITVSTTTTTTTTTSQGYGPEAADRTWTQTATFSATSSPLI